MGPLRHRNVFWWISKSQFELDSEPGSALSHYYRSEVWARQRSRMSSGWTMVGRRTVPVPRRFDSKQLTLAPQLLSKLPSRNMPACQACSKAQAASTVVSVSPHNHNLQPSRCCHPIARERERGDIGSSCCGAAVAANKAASAGSAYAAEQSTNNRVNILPSYLI